MRIEPISAPIEPDGHKRLVEKGGFLTLSPRCALAMPAAIA